MTSTDSSQSAIGEHAATQPFFKLSGVSKRFGGLQALGNVALDIKPGEIYGLIGPNGAGKSSLFNCICGLVPADTGEIMLKGTNIVQRRPHEIVALGLARTFQAVRVFTSLSITENVEIAYTARTKAGLADIIFCLPKERDERDWRCVSGRPSCWPTTRKASSTRGVNDFPEELSTGQQRMLEIIRTLISEPDIILLDEPTGGLNRVWVKQVVELIQKIRDEGRTIFMIEHNMQVVLDLVDRVSVLNFGEVLSEGTPEEVRNDQRVIDAYLG